MKTLTIDYINSLGPCYKAETVLPAEWTGTVIDVMNLKIKFEDRLWVVMRTDLVSEKLMRLFAVWCARQVPQSDGRSLKALEVAEAFANGLATAEELSAAESAARSAARSAAWSAAESAAESAQEVKLMEMLVAGIETGDVL